MGVNSRVRYVLGLKQHEKSNKCQMGKCLYLSINVSLGSGKDLGSDFFFIAGFR